MRGSLVAFAAVLGTLGACSHSYGDAEAPPTTPPITVPEAGPAPEIEGGVSSELDASKAEAASSVNCVTADPSAAVCFDFDLHSVTTTPEEQSAQARVRIDGTGNGTLAVTVDSALGGKPYAAAFYPIQIAGEPLMVRWKFDLQLDAGALSGVDFVQFNTGGPNGTYCRLIPSLTTDTITLTESCSDSAARVVTTLPITRDSHWWTFEFSVDFTAKTATISANDDGSHRTVSPAGVLDNAVASAGTMLMQLGISYADSTAVNASYTIDNFYLYY